MVLLTPLACASERDRGLQTAAVAKAGSQQRDGGQREGCGQLHPCTPLQRARPWPQHEAFKSPPPQEIFLSRVSEITGTQEEKGLSAHQVVDKGLSEIVRKEIGGVSSQVGERRGNEQRLLTYDAANVL